MPASALPPLVALLVGVPAPLTVYGFNARGHSVEQHRPIRAEVAFIAPAATIGDAVPIQVQVGAALATILGRRDGALQLQTRFTTLSGGLVLGPVAPWSTDISVAVFAGPALLFEHLYLDDGFHLDTQSLGIQSGIRLTWGIGFDGRLLGAIQIGWEAYGPPLGRRTYFNHALGRTEIASLSVGIEFAPP